SLNCDATRTFVRVASGFGAGAPLSHRATFRVSDTSAGSVAPFAHPATPVAAVVVAPPLVAAVVGVVLVPLSSPHAAANSAAATSTTLSESQRLGRFFTIVTPPGFLLST